MTTDFNDISFPMSAEQREQWAENELNNIHKRLNIEQLVQAGSDDEQIIAELGVDANIIAEVRNAVSAGQEAYPWGPYEDGLLRCVGKVSTDQLMTDLRAWPYADYANPGERWFGGAWGEVESLRLMGYLSHAEFAELHGLQQQNVTNDGGGPLPLVMFETANQVEAIVKDMLKTDALPRDPEPGSLWLELQRDIFAAYLEACSGERMFEGRAFLLAGPLFPANTPVIELARQTLGAEAEEFGLVHSTFVPVDERDIKQVLLGNPVAGLNVNPELLAAAQAHWDALAARAGLLADGRPLLRGELAALVHSVASATISVVFDRLIQMNVNMVVASTMEWQNQGHILAGKLTEAWYKHLNILAIDTPLQHCLLEAFHDWAAARERGDQQTRFLPGESLVFKFF